MVYLTLCLVFGVATALVARAKGSSWFLWGLIGAIFPVLGLAGVLLFRRESEELRRPCPNCGRVCMLYDALCTRCGAELDFPETAIESRDGRAQRRQPAALAAGARATIGAPARRARRPCPRDHRRGGRGRCEPSTP